MVATILIVAITVVLAAVLYLVVQQLTRTTGSSPLGTVFAWGSPANESGLATPGCAATSHYCYHIEIAASGSSLSVAEFSLALQEVGGSPVAWPTSVQATGGAVELIGPSSPTVLANYWASNATWQTVGPFPGAIGSGFSVVIYCGGAAEASGQGLLGEEIVAVGTGGYSGTVPSTVFS